MTVDSLGKQSASAALTILESGSSGSFQGPFGILDVVLDEASLDDGPGMQSALLDHGPEMDAFWKSLDTGSAEAGNARLFAEVSDLVEESDNTNTLNALMELDSIPNDFSFPFPDLGESANELIFQHALASLSPAPSHGIQESKRIPPLAQDLLRYFQHNVKSLSFPLKNCLKCPWQTVYLPTAMSTFAELSINHTASHTRLSLFYSLLAASCLHMYARDQSAEDLNVSGKRFKDIAAQHLGLALNQEVLGPNRAKYKEILITTLSMVMLAVCFAERLLNCIFANAKV